MSRRPRIYTPQNYNTLHDRDIIGACDHSKVGVDHDAGKDDAKPLCLWYEPQEGVGVRVDDGIVF